MLTELSVRPSFKKISFVFSNMGTGVGVLNRNEGFNKSYEFQIGAYKGDGINSAFMVSHPNCQTLNPAMKFNGR